MIGERLYDLRKEAGLTQDDLAEKLKINKHSISSYERDRSEPPDEIKIEIAKFFNVSVDYLLGLTDISAPIDRQQLVLRLPAGFTPDLLPDLTEYVNYLMYKAEHRTLQK